MDLIQAMEERRSIRAFRTDLVPRQTVEEILRSTILAPSAINLQPWECHIVMGEERERLSRRLIKAYREKRISCSPEAVKPLPKSFAKRGAKTLEGMKPFLEEMGVAPDLFINEGSCNFYGAPVALILSLDDAFGKSRLVDIGIFLGYFILAAHGFGLGTCPIGLITAYEEDVKDLLNLPENKQLVIGIALGYPDWNSPINRFKSSRDEPDKFLRWLD